MSSIVKIPIKFFSDGEPWLLLESVLGKRVIFRAHQIQMKGRVQDFDPHHCDEAHARDSVKCKAKSWDISDKIMTF